MQDYERHARAAGRLFEACDRGDLLIVVLPAVLAECVFVLDTFYGNPRGDIAAALGTLISSPGVEIQRPAIHLDALGRYAKTKVHFVNCLIAAAASAENVPVATFDHDFQRFPDVHIETD